MKTQRVGKKPKETRNEVQKEINILKSEIIYNRKHLDKIWENISEIRERLQDVELFINFNTRLLSIICSERLEMNALDIKRLVRRVKKLTEADIQTRKLEKLFKKESKKGK